MSSTSATAWRLALFSFALAALTGALMRYGMFAGLPGGLLLGDVRHAHSHLMFFGWATPAVMLVLSEAVRRAGIALPAGPWCAIAAAIAGLLAYVPFLLSGYRLFPLGDAELPLSMMASGLNGAVWYAFAVLYLAATWRRPRTTALRFADGAVLTLVVASVGAVLLAVEGMFGTLEQVRMDAYVDMFLTLFADGWFGLAVVTGLLLTVFKQAQAVSRLAGLAWLLSIGLIVRTLARLAVDAYGLRGLALVENVGGLAAGVGWVLVVAVLITAVRERNATAGRLEARVAVLVLALLALKALFELVLALPAGEAFVQREGLYVFLIHAFLLGVVSLALATIMRSLYGASAWRGLGALALLIGVMLACLLPLTGLWPRALAGRWALLAAFYTSLGPPTAALLALLSSRRLVVREPAAAVAPGTAR